MSLFLDFKSEFGTLSTTLFLVALGLALLGIVLLVICQINMDSPTIFQILSITFLGIGWVLLILGVWNYASSNHEKEKEEERIEEAQYESNIRVVKVKFEKEIDKTFEVITEDSDAIYVKDEDGQEWELLYKGDILIEYNKLPKTD